MYQNLFFIVGQFLIAIIFLIHFYSILPAFENKFRHKNYFSEMKKSISRIGLYIWLAVFILFFFEFADIQFFDLLNLSDFLFLKYGGLFLVKLAFIWILVLGFLLSKYKYEKYDFDSNYPKIIRAYKLGWVLTSSGFLFYFQNIPTLIYFLFTIIFSLVTIQKVYRV